MPETLVHQQNVNHSGSNMQSSQTLRVTSPALLSTSRCPQTPLELSNVLSDSARAFSGTSESSRSYGGALRMIRDLTYRMVKFWSYWDLCTDWRETSRTAKNTAQLCRRLREQPRSLCSTEGDLVLYSHSSGSYLTTRHFALSYLSLLQSRDSWHHTMACSIWVCVYIYIRSIWPPMVVEHNGRSPCTRPLRELRDAPLGAHCGETMELEDREPTINTPPHLSRHPNRIHLKERSWFQEGWNQVRRYDSTRCWGSMQLRGSTKSQTEWHQQNVIISLGASGSVWELSDQNPGVVKSQSWLDRRSGFQVHLGAPGSAGDKTGSANEKLGSTWEHRWQICKHRQLAWEHLKSL